MADTFRVLCSELVDIITAHANPDGEAVGYVAETLDRARAALADELAVPDSKEQPSDEELLGLHEWMADEWGANHDAELPPSQYARAVLARWGNPEPAPPADGEGLSNEELWEIYQGDRGTFCPIDFARDVIAADRSRRQAPAPAEEVAELVVWLREEAEILRHINCDDVAANLTRAAKLLQRQAATVPVAVRERMPESKDCDADGMCWWWSNVDGSWHLRRPSHPLVVCSADLLQIWLPFHALPIPEVNNG